jgi:hypothetical protein
MPKREQPGRHTAGRNKGYGQAADDRAGVYKALEQRAQQKVNKAARELETTIGKKGTIKRTVVKQWAQQRRISAEALIHRLEITHKFTIEEN